MNTLEHIHSVKHYLEQHIIGQEGLIERLLIALLSDGHLLVEGAPGLAKTKIINALSLCLEGEFKRIQFTPDLLPSDITGTDIYKPEQHTFEFQPGPIFHHLILADEINRAPAKVQSALLEAMAERQVSVGNHSYPMADLFLVMATQNPLEQEGTYPLPEAQLDRFLMQVNVDYPDAKSELSILNLARNEATQKAIAKPEYPLSQDQLFAARSEVMSVYTSSALDEYIVQLTMATRQGAMYHDSLGHWIDYGVSPRATIALDRCAKAHAWLRRSEFVTPDDIHAIIADVFRHRLVLSYQAEAQGMKCDDVIKTLLNAVPVP